MDNSIGRRDFLKRGIKTGAALAFGSVVADQAFAAKAPQLRAGVAKRKITPPITIPYLASSGNGTCKVFEGIHDDLFARALVLDDGKTQTAVIAVDSIGYDNLILGKGRDFTKELRRHIAAKTPIHRDDIMLTATHAHSTPETIGLTNFRDIPDVAEWIENHLHELANTVIEAWNNRTIVTPRFSKTTVNGIARNRRILLKNKTLSRYGALPPQEQIAAPWFLDEDLSLLSFEKLDGTVHSVLMNYTAHPVVTMLLPKISADYAGAAAEHVERNFPKSVCLFTQGAAGNINSLYVTSRYEDAVMLGEKLGGAAVAELAKQKQSPSMRDFSLHTHSTTVHLQPRHCLSLESAAKTVASNASAENLRLLRLAFKLAQGPMRAEIQSMRIGPVTWISLPGEPFVETGLALKKAGATFVCGYSNGWLGYFPIQRAYDEGGYEVDLGAWSRVAPGSAEILQHSAENLLRKVA